MKAYAIAVFPAAPIEPLRNAPALREDYIIGIRPVNFREVKGMNNTSAVTKLGSALADCCMGYSCENSVQQHFVLCTSQLFEELFPLNEKGNPNICPDLTFIGFVKGFRMAVLENKRLGNPFKYALCSALNNDAVRYALLKVYLAGVHSFCCMGTKRHGILS